MDANPGAIGDRAGTRSSSRAVLRQPAGPWQVFLLTGLAWLLIAVIVLQFTPASAAAAGALAGVAVLLCASGESLITSANSGLPPRSRLARYALAALLAGGLAPSVSSRAGRQASATATAPGTRRGLRDPMPARRRHGSARSDGQSRGCHVARTKEAGA
jgi:hypothetical protein